jgi:hypothetical protein
MTLFLMFFFSFDNIWKMENCDGFGLDFVSHDGNGHKLLFTFLVKFFSSINFHHIVGPPFFWGSFLSYLLVLHIIATFSIQSSLLLLCLANVGHCILSFFFFVSTLWSQIKKLSSSSSNLQNSRMRWTNSMKRRSGMDSTNLDSMIWSNAIN